MNYTDRDGTTQIVEYRLRGNTFDPDSAKVLLSIKQPYENHNGGQLQFGPDGMLWIGMGDGGAGGDPENRAQNPDELLGKLLRIDVDNRDGDTKYGIPSGNPFADGGGRPEIAALGMRNPWRFSFDRVTGALWIGDVGQDTWEEIDAVPAGMAIGANFGWNRKEGTHSFSETPWGPGTHVEPVHEYTRSDGVSVTGGYVYRGTDVPGLKGWYVFTDMDARHVRLLPGDPKKARGARPRKIDAPDSVIVSFGEDTKGELYVVSLNGGIWRIEAG